MKALVRFGEGQTLITGMTLPSSENTLGRLYLQEGHGSGVVGDKKDSHGFRYYENDVVLQFGNTESLDVLVRQLLTLKELMQGTLKDAYRNPIEWESIPESKEATK